jgi:hypothetical protein
LDFVVGLYFAQTVHEFSRTPALQQTQCGASVNEWEDLNSGIRGLIRGWFATKPQIPVEPENFRRTSGCKPDLHATFAKDSFKF